MLDLLMPLDLLPDGESESIILGAGAQLPATIHGRGWRGRPRRGGGETFASFIGPGLVRGVLRVQDESPRDKLTRLPGELIGLQGERMRLQGELTRLLRKII